MNQSDPIKPAGNVLIEGMPDEQYHAIRSLSSSGAKKIRRSPAHFDAWWREQKPPTGELLFGRAAHVAVIEPDRFESAVLAEPKLDRRTKEGKAQAEAFAAEAAGRIVLPADDFERCLRVRDSVARHAGAQRLMVDSMREVSLFWTDGAYGVDCKMRADGIRRGDGGIWDLKTTQDASRAAFGRTIAAYEYHAQAAFYVSGAEHVIGRTPDFFAFIAVEKEAPFAVACYVLETAHLLAGARLTDEALSAYRQALDAGTWPAYPDLIQTAQLPAWALRFDNPL